MGLFDKRDKKKKTDDFDSPVEKVDLSAPAEAVEMTAEPPPESKPAPTPTPAAAAAPAASKPAAAARKPDPEPDMDDDYDTGFGIDKAIELMRTLPSDNVELVVQVVKLTLESTKVRISTIIDDASRRQDDIQGRIKVLNEEIAEYEKEIAQRKEEISGLEADYEETTTVKDRLQLAEKITKKPAGSAASGSHKAISSAGRDQAKAAGSIGGGLGGPSSSSSATSSSTGSGKHSVVVKK